MKKLEEKEDSSDDEDDYEKEEKLTPMKLASLLGVGLVFIMLIYYSIPEK